MGANESKQYAKRLSANCAALLSQYRPTGNAAEDKRLAKELSGEPNVWDTVTTPYNICDPLWDRVRLLDPRNPECAQKHANLCVAEADRLAEPAKSQMFARAERLFAETIRLGEPDYDRGIHRDWASAVIAQGPHRAADQQAILQRASGIKRHPREDREDAAAAEGKKDWAAAIKWYRVAYSKSGAFDDIYEVALCFVAWKSFSDEETVQACRAALQQSTAQEPAADDYGDVAVKHRSRVVMLTEMIVAAPYYRDARLHEHQHDLGRAIQAADQAERAYRCYETRDLLSRLLVTAERWREASRVLRNGYLPDPIYQNREHVTRLAFVYFKEQRYVTALKVLDLETNRTGILEEERTQCYATRREYTAAQNKARQAASNDLEDPHTSARALVDLASFFYFERQYDLSIKTIRRALTLDAMNQDAASHGSLADALWATKAQDESREHYKRALDLDPSNLQSFLWQCRTGYRPEPSEYWADTLKHDPCAQHFGAIGLDFNTASRFHGDGSIPAWQAEEALSIALQLDPEHPDGEKWKAHRDRIRALIRRTEKEVQLRKEGKDPLENRIKANAYQKNHGYGVVGSTNEYTLQYGPGGTYNTWTN